MPQEWFTTETLATVAGATIAVRIVVEHTKVYVDKLTGNRIPTLFYALLVAFGLLFGVQGIQGTVTVENAFLNVFNAFLMVLLAKLMEKEDA